MEGSDERESQRSLIASVKGKWEDLPPESHVKSALPITKFDELSTEIEADSPENLKYRYWPPVFLFIERQAIAEILELDSDLDSVIDHSKERQPAEITSFLKAGPNDDRRWCAGLFEVFVKAKLLKEAGAEAVKFDYPFPNGRNADLRLEMDGKAIYLECTVITDSDEDRGTWDRFLEAKKVDPEVMLTRPGQFSPPDAKSPSSYYDCLRFYAKAYDKLAKDLDPRKSQCSDDSPNILLVSFHYWAGHLTAKSHGAGWALDELFADQPNLRPRLKDAPPGITDIALVGWLDFMAKELIDKSRLDGQSYARNFNALLRAPAKLGGALLFDDCSLKRGRINYNAQATCRLTHREMAELETILGASPSWRPQAWINGE